MYQMVLRIYIVGPACTLLSRDSSRTSRGIAPRVRQFGLLGERGSPNNTLRRIRGCAPMLSFCTTHGQREDPG